MKHLSIPLYILKVMEAYHPNANLYAKMQMIFSLFHSANAGYIYEEPTSVTLRL